MPQWSSDDENDEMPEDWPTVLKVITELQKRDEGTKALLDALEPPERDELEKAITRSVAEILTQHLLKSPQNISQLPNPHLLVHTMAMGVLSGLIYAHSHHIAETNQQEEEPDGSEQPAD